MTIRGALTRLRTEKRNLVAPALTSCPRADPNFAMFTVTVTNCISNSVIGAEKRG